MLKKLFEAINVMVNNEENKDALTKFDLLSPY
jgi:hypothetical protein